MKTILNIINEYPSLKKALKHIILTNKANNAPYHNLNHLLTVTRHCYNATEFDTSFGYDFREELLMAALFHDYNHSMGEQNDEWNVDIAIQHLAAFNHKEQLNLDIGVMTKILRATQYPYVIPSEDLNVYQRIIRDADLCQIYEYNWLQQNIFGLSQEMKIPVEQLIPGQRKFLESITPLTDYGRFMHDTYFVDVMKELEILENIMV
jgi:hypothetical protein